MLRQVDIGRCYPVTEMVQNVNRLYGRWHVTKSTFTIHHLFAIVWLTFQTPPIQEIPFQSTSSCFPFDRLKHDTITLTNILLTVIYSQQQIQEPFIHSFIHSFMQYRSSLKTLQVSLNIHFRKCTRLIACDVAPERSDFGGWLITMSWLRDDQRSNGYFDSVKKQSQKIHNQIAALTGHLIIG